MLCQSPCILSEPSDIAFWINGKVVKFLTEVNTASFSSLLIISLSGSSFETLLKLGLRISSQDATKLLFSFKLGFFPEK